LNETAGKPQVPSEKGAGASTPQPVQPAPAPAAPATSEEPASSDDPPTSDEHPAEDPVMSTDALWMGKIAKVSSGRFGGTNCNYTATLSDITVKVTLDPMGKVKTAEVTGKMSESRTSACSSKPLSSNLHTYTFAPVGEPSADAEIKLAPASSNQPRAELVLTRSVVAGDTMKSTLWWHRIDATASMNWTMQSEAALHVAK
jgi:hypothetical protein